MMKANMMNLVEVEEELHIAQRERGRKFFKICLVLTLVVGVPVVGLMLHHASLNDSQRSVVERIFN